MRGSASRWLKSSGLSSPAVVAVAGVGKRRKYSQEVERVDSPNPNWKPGDKIATPLEPAETVKLHPANLSSAYPLLISAVVPRPVAVISSLSPCGNAVNVAPFSYFMPICHAPPMLAVSINHQASKQKTGGKKDTLMNVEATGEYVVNVLSDWYVEAVNHCSGDWEEDELKLSGLTSVPSDIVKPPRIGEAGVQMECKVYSLQEFKDPSTGTAVTTLIVGQVVLFHVHPSLLDDDSLAKGRPSLRLDRLRPVSRLGGNTYGLTTRTFDVPRPRTKKKDA